MNLKKRWEEILNKPINENKSFSQHGAYGLHCDLLRAYIHSKYKVNIGVEEVMDNTIKELERVIIKEQGYQVKHLCCIEKKVKMKKKKKKLSYQQEELANEYFHLLGYDYK